MAPAHRAKRGITALRRGRRGPSRHYFRGSAGPRRDARVLEVADQLAVGSEPVDVAPTVANPWIAEPPRPPLAAPTPAPVPLRRRGGRGWRRLRTALFIAGAAALLWPAQFGGTFGLTTQSGDSMGPQLDSGDVVISQRQDEYAVGDLVAYTIPAGQSLARGQVVRKVTAVTKTPSGVLFTTRGVAESQNDPWAVYRSDILGKKVAVLPRIGEVLGAGTVPLVLAVVISALVLALLAVRGPARPEPRRAAAHP